MKMRSKVFLALPLGIALAVSVAGNKSDPIVPIGVLYVTAWLGWRAFVFLSILFRPVRRKMAPVDAHLNDSLRRSGLGAMANAGERFQASIDVAVKNSEDAVARKSGIEPGAGVPTPETHVRCPDCRELVFKDARICRFCKCKLMPQ